MAEIVPLPFERDVGVPEPYGRCEWLRVNLTAYNGYEETYNPLQALADVYTSYKLFAECWRFLQTTNNPFADLLAVAQLRVEDFVVVFLMTLGWALARYLLCDLVFKPFCRVWKMHKNSGAKFPESAFKTFAFFTLWASACYVTFCRDYTFFSNTLSLWADCRYKFGHAPLDLRLVYGLETSFYFYSCYTCLYVDKWKKDTPVMLMHHVVTLTLILFSYSVNYLKIGVIIFVLNDISDVLLEAGKCFAYMKVRGARYAEVWNTLALVCSVFFVAAWFVFRNVFHLTKVWRSSSYGSFCSAPYLPPMLWLFFNVLVGSLYLFYMYWFYYIVLYIVRIWSGTMKDPDDPRDEDVEEKLRKKQLDEELTTPTKKAGNRDATKRSPSGGWFRFLSSTPESRKTD